MNETGMHICRKLLLAAMLLSLNASLTIAQESAAVKTWQVFQVEMTGTQTETNPYVAWLREGKPAHVTVRFTGVSGQAAGKEIAVVPGFWDGGTTWKARFAAPAPGEWTYREPVGGPRS